MHGARPLQCRSSDADEAGTQSPLQRIGPVNVHAAVEEGGTARPERAVVRRWSPQAGTLNDAGARFRMVGLRAGCTAAGIVDGPTAAAIPQLWPLESQKGISPER